jgi:hypothetical protein
MRDLKRNFPHFFRPVKYSEKVFSCAFRFGYDFPFEKISYYNGRTFRSILFKEFIAGHIFREFIRTKVTGSTIHIRNKKRTKK